MKVSRYYTEQREVMEEMISADEGILLRVNRAIQSEGTFAMIKEDMNFRRFMTRGKQTVMAEWHLVSIAFNILQLYHKIQTDRLESRLGVAKATHGAEAGKMFLSSHPLYFLGKRTGRCE